jgi:transposase
MVEVQRKKLYLSLSEKDRRRYAAITAMNLGYDGISQVARELGCSRQTIAKGIKELEQLDEEKFNQSRIRQPGVGRKRMVSVTSGLNEAFLEVLRNHTAGSPTDEKIRWTNLTEREIALGLKAQGFPVSITVVKQLLKTHGYVKRQAQKKQTIGTNPQRNAQLQKP